MADLAKSMVCLDEPRAIIVKLLRAGCAAKAPGRNEYIEESDPVQPRATRTADAPAFFTSVAIWAIETVAGS